MCARADEALEIARESQHHVHLAWTIQYVATTAALSSPDDHQPPFEKLANVARLIGYVDARSTALSATRQCMLRDTISVDEPVRVMLAGAA